MTIDPEQKNVEALCDVAHFVDSGFQSFHEQTQHMKAGDAAENAFYAGAALALKLTQYFKDPTYSAEDVERLMCMLYEEVNAFMKKNGMQLEWEPHVPKEVQQ